MPPPIDRRRYLCISPPIDWSNELNKSLGFLRDSWSEVRSGGWIGVPQVLDTCISLLIAPDQFRQRHCNLIRSARMVAINIELNANQIVEPNYHNRLHFCDALTGICILMLIEKERTGVTEEYWCALLLLIVVSHDYMHPGGQNKQAMEIENNTIHHLRRIWSVCPIDNLSLDYLTYIIQKSDPRYVGENHKIVINVPFEWNKLWATVLVNEADIIASCTTQFGSKLGQQLLSELQHNEVCENLLYLTHEIRRNFLESASFSSPASHILKIQSQVQVELS